MTIFIEGHKGRKSYQNELQWSSHLSLLRETMILNNEVRKGTRLSCPCALLVCCCLTHESYAAPAPGTDDSHVHHASLSGFAHLNWSAQQFSFFLLQWHSDYEFGFNLSLEIMGDRTDNSCNSTLGSLWPKLPECDVAKICKDNAILDLLKQYWVVLIANSGIPVTL